MLDRYSERILEVLSDHMHDQPFPIVVVTVTPDGECHIAAHANFFAAATRKTVRAMCDDLLEQLSLRLPVGRG